MRGVSAMVAAVLLVLLAGPAHAADWPGGADYGSDDPVAAHDPAIWQRDRRQCEVWAARKSGAAANSAWRDLWRKGKRGAAHGAAIGLVTGNWVTGAWIGAEIGVLDVAIRHTRFGHALTYCLKAKGYVPQ